MSTESPPAKGSLRRRLEVVREQWTIFSTLVPTPLSLLGLSGGLSFLAVLMESLGYAVTIRAIQQLVQPDQVPSPLALPPFLAAVAMPGLERNFAFILSTCIALFLARVLCNLLAEFILSRHHQSSLAEFRVRLFDRILRFSKLTHDRMPPGRLQNGLLSASSGLFATLPMFRRGVMLIASGTGYLFVLSQISLPLTAASILILPLVFFLTQLVSRNLGDVMSNETKNVNQATLKVAEVLSYLPLTRQMLAHRLETSRFGKLAGEMRDSTLAYSRSQSLLNGFTEAASIILLLIVALIQRQLTVMNLIAPHAGTLVFFVVLKRLGSLAGEFLWLRKSLRSTVPHVDELNNLLLDPLKALEPALSRADAPEPAADRPPIASVRFDEVGFGYEHGKLALRGLTFELKAKERVALIGASGTGKSTIIGLLLRLFEAESGSVRIDGVPTRDLPLEVLRRQVVAVTQDLHFLNDTILNNLYYGLDGPLDEALAWEALTHVQLADWLRGEAAGLQLVVGNGGLRLSAGQRQRLAIARAIIRRPRLLLLDEAMSNVDFKTEGQIVEALNEALPDAIILFVTHRDPRDWPVQRILRLTGAGMETA